MSMTIDTPPTRDQPAAGSSVGEDSFNSPLVLTVIWILLLVVFLMYPACSTKRRRRIWKKRWQERRWNVQVEEEPLEDWFVVALARYREALQREAEASQDRRAGNATGTTNGRQAADIIWKEKEEAILRTALTDDLLRGYTKTLAKAHFVDVVPEDECSPQNAEDNKPPDVAPSDNDIELGVRVTNISQQQQDTIEEKAGDEDRDNSNEEVLIHKSDSVLEGAYRVQLPLPGFAHDECSESLPSGSADCAGEKKDDETGFANKGVDNSREVPNGCAICMDPFYFGDRVCWSSNGECPHAFHEKCIINWLLVLGRRRRIDMQRPIQSSEGPEDEEDVDLTDYPMLCPCCRQEFVSKPSQAPLPTDIEQAQQEEESTTV